MLTGASPAVHGMRSNFVPNLGGKCESVFDVLRRGGRRGAPVGGAHTGGGVGGEGGGAVGAGGGARAGGDGPGGGRFITTRPPGAGTRARVGGGPLVGRAQPREGGGGEGEGARTPAAGPSLGE